MIKVVFFATPKIALKSLEVLIDSDKIDVVAVVTQPDKPAGRGHIITPPPVKELALKHNIPVFQPISLKKDFEIQDELIKLEPDFFVTFAFGQILSRQVLDIPKYATINLHASLLPLYRGANPIQRAIINGDKKTGICTMVTEEGLDCGSICLRDEIEITENMNYVELFNLIAEKSPELIQMTLINMKCGAIKPIEQHHEKVTYAHKITKEEAQINWDQSARQIHNLVRGLYKFPSANCFFNGKFIKILETRVIEDSFKGTAGEVLKVTKEGIEIATVEGILRIQVVKPEGKGELLARDWANGAKIKMGDKFS